MIYDGFLFINLTHIIFTFNSHKLINLSKIHSFIVFVFLKGLVSEFSIALPPCLLYSLISTCKSFFFFAQQTRGIKDYAK